MTPRPAATLAAAIGAAVAVLAMLAGCAAQTASLDSDAAADIEIYTQQHLDAEWQRISGGTDRPPAGAALFFVPYGWDHVIESCMEASGFTSSDAKSTTASAADPGLTGAAGLAWYDCLERYPTFTVHYTELEPSQLRKLYDYYAAWLVPCLALSGRTPGEIPSLADFESGDPGRPGGWNPYLTSSRPPSLAAARILFERCPPYPDSPWVPPAEPASRG